MKDGTGVRSFVKLRNRIGLTLMCTSLFLCIAGALTGPRPASMSFEPFGDREPEDVWTFPSGTVSVNFCDLETLTALPGIGVGIGQAILDEREANGYFYYPEDLLAVRGIGEAKLAGFREYLDLSLTESKPTGP